MKKISPYLFAATLLTVFNAQASDLSAILSISGNATNEGATCGVVINPATLSIESSIDNMPVQGAKAVPKNAFNLRLTGNSQCYALAEQNRIAYRFLGAGDSYDGSVLANMDISSEAATGVGVGLYDLNGIPVNLNAIIPVANISSLDMELVSLKGHKQTAGNVNSTLTVQIERL